MKARLIILALGLYMCCPAARAEVTLSPLFTDHAVLQASDRVPVWGRATPGEAVTVTLGDNVARAAATTGPDGKWSATLDLHKTGAGPYDLVAAGPRNQVKSVDVLVGEVWVCSGQSNMEFVLRNSAGAAQEIAASANPSLRQFIVPKSAEAAPANTLKGRWEVAGPTTSGSFTAVGYYFGKQVQATLHVPVGLIHSSWGGTPVEAWTSTEGFAASVDPALKEAPAKKRAEFAAYQKFFDDRKAWQVRFAREDHPHAVTAPFTAPARDGEAEWKTVVLPVAFATAGLPDAGATWLQRTIPLKDVVPGQNAVVSLGDLHGSLEVYWNGKKVGGGDFFNEQHNFWIDGSELKAGDNVLAVRVFEGDHGAGITAGKAKLQVEVLGVRTPLDGPWLAKAEFVLPPLSADQQAFPAKPPVIPGGKQNTAGYLYNGMIAPLLPCALRGVLWYQGEANTGRAAQYREAFPLLINDWRTRWGRGDFAFYWCQLANFQGRPAQPRESGWAELRDAQTAARKLPNTGEAILIDLGEEADIHPKNKADVGARLARIALAKTYGQKGMEWSGPLFDGMKVEAGGKVRLKFSHAEGGLVATAIPATYQPSSLKPETKPNERHSSGGQLEGFAVCGADHQWHWATAANIDGDSVVLTCAEVTAPVAVRYAWADNPLCNLANRAGLPAGPFRTDDLPLSTAGSKY